MGGSSSGGGKFVERGTPLSQAYLNQRSATKAAQSQRPPNDSSGGDNARGYEGGVVDGRTGLGIGFGIAAAMATAALTGEPITALTTGYQTYSSFTEETDPKTGKVTRGYLAQLSDVFGSLLGNEDTTAEDTAASVGGVGGSDGFGGGFGGDIDGGQGMGGTSGAYA